MLESVIKFAGRSIGLCPHDGVLQIGETLCARRDAELVLFNQPHDWTLALLALVGPTAFVAVALDPDANIAGFARCVAHVRLGERPSLVRYHITVRRAAEIAADRPKKNAPRVAIETIDAVKLAPSYGRMSGARPGRSRAHMSLATRSGSVTEASHAGA